MVNFQDSRDRIDRAQAHRAVFSDGWKALLKRIRQKPIIQVQQDGTGSISVEPPPLPNTLSLELGEMMYQLRAALDACVYRAAILDSGMDPPPNENALEFPICSTFANWNDSGRKIGPLADKRKLIVEDMQPCNAAKHPGTRRIIRSLGILNDWARKDRHRRLHIVRTWRGTVFPTLTVGDPARLVSMVARPPGFSEGDTEVARFIIEGWVPGTELKAGVRVPFDVALDEPPPPEDFADTLDRRIGEMFYAVLQVVEMFEKSYEPPYLIRIPRP
jgi:hypothetical protein